MFILIFIFNTYILIKANITSVLGHMFTQIAGSAVRLLTNIPHCCTIRIGVFSDPMWSIDLPVTTTGFPLVKQLP